MYADDLLLFKPISCQQDLSIFQCDVNLISQWTLQNHLSLNCNKTKYMLISRSRPGSCNYFNSPIYVYNIQIERVHQYKYLGVWISDDLTWSKHIESVCSKQSSARDSANETLYQFNHLLLEKRFYCVLADKSDNHKPVKFCNYCSGLTFTDLLPNFINGVVIINFLA